MNHIPVLTKEVISFLAPKKNENFIDATIGFGGHARLILEKTVPNGRLLGIDQDNIALEQAKENLKKYSNRIDLVNTNFSNLGLIIRDWEKEVNGILFDLGISSYQLTSKERGFSFQEDAPLDMRMSQKSQKLSAKDIVNSWDKNRLKSIFKNYGQEPYAGKISVSIIKNRSNKPIIRTSDLLDIIENAIPTKDRVRRHHHFATNVFRALRMAVNDELNHLENALKQSVQILAPKGRLVVISFHSLEDRIVKKFFNNNNQLEILTKKPVLPGREEIQKNPRSRSAKLRAAVKIE